MYLDRLTTAVVGIVLLAASAGQLPKLIYAVRKAQIQLIQETKASKWGQVPLLPESSARTGRGLIK